MSSSTVCTARSAEAVKPKGGFRISYQRGGVSLLLFGVLVFIALFVRDDFIRPFVGDVLVVVWLYYLISSLWQCQPLKLAGVVYGIAFMVEISQYLHVLHWFGGESNTVLRVIFGATFDWMDLVAYLIGVGVCIIVDRKEFEFGGLVRKVGLLRNKRRNRSTLKLS